MRCRTRRARPGIVRAAHRGPGHSRIVDDRNPARRAGESVGPEVPGADTVGQPVVGRPRDRRVGAEHRPGPLTRGRAGVPIDPAAAHRHRRPHRLPRRPGDDVDGPGHGVRAPGGRRGPAHHLDLFDVAVVGRQQVPHDQAEEVQVDAAAVHQHELRVGHRPGGLPAGDLDVAGRELNHVDAGHRAEDVADVGARRGRQRFAGDDGGGDRGIDDPDLGSRRGDDHRVAEARERQRDRWQLHGNAGHGDVRHRRLGKAGQRHRHDVVAGGDACEHVLAATVGLRDAGPLGTAQRDRRARQHGGGLVDDAAADPARLRFGPKAPEEQQDQADGGWMSHRRCLLSAGPGLRSVYGQCSSSSGTRVEAEELQRSGPMPASQAPAPAASLRSPAGGRLPCEIASQLQKR